MLVSSDEVVLRPVAAVQDSSGVRDVRLDLGEIWWRWSLVWSWTADSRYPAAAHGSASRRPQSIFWPT